MCRAFKVNCKPNQKVRLDYTLVLGLIWPLRKMENIEMRMRYHPLRLKISSQLFTARNTYINWDQQSGPRSQAHPSLVGILDTR